MFFEKIRRFRHTLAFRLTFWYAGIFTLSACLAFAFFYFLITSVLQERTDQELLSQANRYAAIMNIQGMETVKQTAVLESQAAGEKKIFFRLLYPSGIVFGSSNMAYWKNIGIEREAIRKLIRGDRRVFDTVILPERKHKVRILYTVIGLGTILQLGQSMEHLTTLVDAFRRIFVVTMSALFLFAVLIGWFMARQALAGVGNISRTAQQIAAGSLDVRVPLQSRGDEIDILAKTFNQMLDRIQKLVTGIKEMSDNIAHDLRSLITRIRGTAEVTLTTENSIEAYQKMAAGTIEECDRLLDMINTMLVISKTEAGVGSQQFQPLDIREVVQKACDLFHPMAEDQNVEIVCHAVEPMTVLGDVRMIQRMIANLIDNAIKYTPAGGVIHVTLRNSSPDKLQLSVSDTGIGISADNLPHIFERFFRGDPSRATSGIGLGLSLAGTIARSMGGDIEVSSRPDHGSTFTVTLPCIAPSSQLPDSPGIDSADSV